MRLVVISIKLIFIITVLAFMVMLYWNTFLVAVAALFEMVSFVRFVWNN